MTKELRVLTVFSDFQLARTFQDLLSRRKLEVNRVPSGTGALILTGNLGYDLIIIEHPLTDISTEEFLASIRTIDSTSTASPVLVVCPDEDVDQLARELDDNLLRTVSREADAATTHAAVASLLGVAERCAVRVMVQLDVALGGAAATRIHQSENLSESGILLRGGTQIPVGTTLRFAFTLPDETDPITGSARVVRHTGVNEPIRGIALHFSEVPKESVERLRRFTLGSSGRAPVTSESVSEGTTDSGQRA